MKETIILFGASSAIAKAYARELDKQTQPLNLICISRGYEEESNFTHLKVSYFKTDYTKESLFNIIRKIRLNNPVLTQSVIFNGQLHTEEKMPERKLEDLESHYFHQIMESNVYIPMLCLSSLTPLLNTHSKCTLTILSARIGSIKDNKLGGWYSYRASKAALNMMFKSAAIEISRKAKATTFILFHPGTTETALSKPFRKNIPKGKLFSPEFVAQQLLVINQNTSQHHQHSKGEVAFLDWDGKTIPW